MDNQNSAPRAALFDLDGVLIDSEGGYTRFWAEIGRRYNHPSPTFALDIKGTTLTQILSAFPDDGTREEIKLRIHEFEQEMDYPLFDGARELLQLLHDDGWRTAIVTSSDNVKMDYLRRSHPWLFTLVDVIINGSMVTRSKPHPEGYLRAATELGVAPERCIVFEDSLQGLEAGRRTGAKVVGFTTTNSAEAVAPLCDLLLPTVAEVTLPLLRTLIP